jgi:MFS family permease
MSVEPVTPPTSSATTPPAGSTTDGDRTEGGGLWAPERRGLTIGLVLTITLVAFEAMAVATIMPEVKDDLGGLGLYGWVFSGFSLASLAGIVVAGQLVDRHGLALPYVAGLSLFAAGLVLGGAANTMAVLVLGRILQGFGAGAIPATAYAAIARGIPAELRPKMFAVMSTAWVVPGLLGPVAALALLHATSWRWVFFILLPLVAVAGSMTLRSLAALGAAPLADTDERTARDRQRLRKVVLLVVGVGAVFTASSVDALPVVIGLIAIGVPVAVLALVHLLPPGTLRLAPGVPAAVAVRGILTFSFFAADAFVPLAIVDGRGADSWVGGLALTVAAVAWAGGSWLQARLIHRAGPRRLDQIGFASLVVAIALLLAMALGAPVAVAVVGWTIGGFAIGLSYAPLSVTVLAGARPGEEGAASAAIQLTDALGIALGTGLGGWIIAAGDGRGWAVSTSATWVFVLAGVGAIGGVLAASRLPRRLPSSAPSASG